LREEKIAMLGNRFERPLDQLGTSPGVLPRQLAFAT
jgi:hypothetical protein